MADFTIALTVPDDKVTDLVAALQWQFGPNEDGSDKTAAELRADLKARTEQSLKDVYKRHKEYLRSQQTVDADIDIT